MTLEVKKYENLLTMAIRFCFFLWFFFLLEKKNIRIRRDKRKGMGQGVDIILHKKKLGPHKDHINAGKKKDESKTENSQVSGSNREYVNRLPMTTTGSLLLDKE